MNEGAADLQPKRSSTVVKCEKHGLHYDSSTMSGCVICRREAGGGPTEASGSSGTRTVVEAKSGSLGQALLVTLGLLALTTAGLYLTHGMMVKHFKGMIPGQGRETTLDSGFEGKMDDMGVPTAATEPGDTYSGPEGDGD